MIMIPKNSVLKIHSLVVHHESRPVKSNPIKILWLSVIYFRNKAGLDIDWEDAKFMGTSEQEDIQNVLPLFFSKILIVELFTPYLVYQVIICKELLVKLKQLEGGIKLLFTHNGVA